MISTIFDAIVDKLKTIDSLKGTDGTVRVYRYPTNKGAGYPFAYVVFEGATSVDLDNQRNKVTYQYMIRIVQEVFEETGFTPEKGEQVARDETYEVCGVFRADNDLGIAKVLKTTPIKADKGYINNSTQLVIDITLQVETAETIIQ